MVQALHFQISTQKKQKALHCLYALPSGCGAGTMRHVVCSMVIRIETVEEAKKKKEIR